MALGPLKQLLIDRTEANPLFLEESVRALVETAALVGERGAYRLTRPVEQRTIPATVQAILATRIDRLAPEAKCLRQAAAVIGKDVPMPLLLAIADAPEHEVRAELTHLQAAEFLYETRLFQDLEYTFKHALTHEVAYGGLPPAYVTASIRSRTCQTESFGEIPYAPKARLPPEAAARKLRAREASGRS